MSLSEFELHPERLGTTDETGRRIFLHPADVKGRLRNARTSVQAVLLVFFLILPWLKVAGHQALLLDIANRKFEIFGLSLRAHNAPLLFFVFAAAAFALFFATAIWGRVWCGWACPQTVFIDGVFRRVERWIEGSALERRKLDKAPWTIEKIAKRGLKWTISFFAALVITHSFLAYFVGTETLSQMIQRSPLENPTSFLFIAFSTAIIFWDFVWFREQFCTIVCPYGRFQSVLMDDQSMIVAYDSARGEPRATPQAKLLAKTHNSNLGDCVNCYRCVQVCPTGIDIRRGVQMECIACTGCIDACNEVMRKIKKPEGLIRYDSMRGLKNKKRRFPVRAAFYLAAFIAAVVSLGISVSRMQPLEVEILRAKGEPYQAQTEADGSRWIINHFKVEVSNQTDADQKLIFKTDDPSIQLIFAQAPFEIDTEQIKQADFFIRAPQTIFSAGQKIITVRIENITDDKDRKLVHTKELPLAGPFR